VREAFVDGAAALFDGEVAAVDRVVNGPELYRLNDFEVGRVEFDKPVLGGYVEEACVVDDVGYVLDWRGWLLASGDHVVAG